MASVTSVCIKPLDFTLTSLALLSLMRSAAVSMSVSQSSNLVESCSLKTGMFSNKEFVRLDCFCIEHKVSVYCSITSPRGSAGAGGVADGWQLTDSEVHAVCSQRSQLVVLLQLLLFDVNQLFPCKCC